MQVTEYSDIFGYIQGMENAYRQPIQVNEKDWSMRDHIRRSELYNNSDIEGNKTSFTPIRNITRPILNLQHRTEDIEVKDVQLYVDDPDKYHLSFLVKKYHDDVFVVENNIDTFFDELNISRIDFGAGLSKQLDKPCPEVVPLQSIAFCDQTDILSGPIGIKHFYSPDQLLEMEQYGWGKPSSGATATVQDVIDLSREEKNDDGQRIKTPGRYIEVYEVHGNLPKRFASHDMMQKGYETRLFIVCFYQKPNSTEKQGIILYSDLEPKSPFKIIKRDPVYGRALGFGGAEELFEAQTWVNYDVIRMQDMLDAASKTVLVTDDPTLAGKHPSGLKDVDNLELLTKNPGTTVEQLNTFPRNIQLFETSMDKWETHAQQMGAANDAIMGESPASGTPFKLQELVTQEAHGLHEYRRGQYAKHLEEIYNDWIIPHIQKKICEGTRFLAELSLEDLQYVSDCLVRNAANDFIKEKILNGENIDPKQVDELKQQTLEEFQRKGNKHFIEILKGEFRRVPVAVKVSVAGKNKNLAAVVDKITNIFRFAFSNPQGFAQVLQIPGMAKSFNEILEFSGLSPADFSGMDKYLEKMQQQSQPPQQPQLPPQQAAMQQIAQPQQ